MATQRKVQGYITDTARPNWKKDVEFDLDSLPVAGSAARVPAAVAATVSAAETGGPVLRKTVFTLTGHSVTMTDAGANGCHGSVQLCDFPVGLIQIIGATMALATTAGSGGIADGAAVVQSVGTVTVANTNATLTSTEADIIPSTAGTLTGGANAAGVGVSTTPAVFDGHSTAVKAFLNFAVPDADSSASDTLAVTGTVTVFWHYFGDV